MCYNATMSLTFGIIGLFTSIYIALFCPTLNKTYIHYILLFYTTMEFLQTFQYNYVNQCNNIINIVLTEIAYILVIVQPLIWNIFFYINTKLCEKQIFIVGIILGIIWMIINLLSRLLYMPQNGKINNNSIFASNKTCTKINKSHLFWKWTSADFGDMTANYLMYLLIWFIPAFVSKSFRILSFITFIFAIIGLIMSLYANELNIWPSVWCYISVPMIISVIIYLYYNKD